MVVTGCTKMGISRLINMIYRYMIHQPMTRPFDSYEVVKYLSAAM